MYENLLTDPGINTRRSYKNSLLNPPLSFHAKHQSNIFQKDCIKERLFSKNSKVKNSIAESTHALNSRTCLKTDNNEDSEQEIGNTRYCHTQSHRISKSNSKAKFSKNENTKIQKEKKLLNEITIPEKDNRVPYEYLTEIFNNLNLEEKRMMKNKITSLSNQTDINEKMRAIIINWVIEVHSRFKLCPDSLFLCVNLIDRYLSKKTISRKDLQLISVVSLLVACKCEEIFSPEIRDFVCIMDKSYEARDVVLMERKLLKILKFEITVPSAIKFYEILSIKLQMPIVDFHFGMYLLECSLISSKLSKYLPSLVASAACYVASVLFKCEEEKNKNLKLFYNVINYTKEELVEVVLDLCFVYHNIEHSSYQAIKKKYQANKHFDKKMFTLNVKE